MPPCCWVTRCWVFMCRWCCSEKGCHSNEPLTNLEVKGGPSGSNNTAQFSKRHELSLASNYKAVELHFVNDWLVPSKTGMQQKLPLAEAQDRIPPCHRQVHQRKLWVVSIPNLNVNPFSAPLTYFALKIFILIHLSHRDFTIFRPIISGWKWECSYHFWTFWESSMSK